MLCLTHDSLKGGIKLYGFVDSPNLLSERDNQVLIHFVNQWVFSVLENMW